MIPELTYREWPERFEAVRFPRGNLVVAFPQRWVEASCTSMEVAEEHAAAMNRWLAAKPEPSLAPALPNFAAPATERQLFDLLDRGLEPERKAEALKAGLTS